MQKQLLENSMLKKQSLVKSHVFKIISKTDTSNRNLSPVESAGADSPRHKEFHGPTGTSRLCS